MDTTLATLQTRQNKMLDLRNIAVEERCLRISTAFEVLAPKDSFVLIVDMNPELHHCHLQSEFGDRVHWEILKAGPEIWQILITKNM
jgi:uncharacterized protein (DUF2249 family)